MRKLFLPPVCVAVRPQLHRADCGLAALAMALGLPYEQVFQAAPLAAREGLTPRQLQSIATKLGARLLSHWDVDLHADTGIVGLTFKQGLGHWAVLYRGVLIDPADGLLWDTDDYFAHYQGDWDCFYTVHPARVRQRGKKQ